LTASFVNYFLPYNAVAVKNFNKTKVQNELV